MDPSQTPWKCYKCNENFDGKKGLNQHKLSVHGSISNCEKCGKVFNKLEGLKNHISFVHEGKRPFQCESCGKGFGRKDNLKEHIRQVHDGIKRKHLKRNNS